MITFSILEPAEPVRGRLVYRPSEFSFSFKPERTEEFSRRKGSPTSLSIGYLQLEVGIETGFLLYTWGLHGHHLWKRGSLPTLHAKPGIVKANFNREMKMGVSVRFIPEGQWITIYDPTSGWVYVGPEAMPAADHHVEFADNTVAALAGENLAGLWLRPQMEAQIERTSEDQRLATRR